MEDISKVVNESLTNAVLNGFRSLIHSAPLDVAEDLCRHCAPLEDAPIEEVCEAVKAWQATEKIR